MAIRGGLLGIACVCVLGVTRFSGPPAAARENTPRQPSGTRDQVTIPARPDRPAFQGQQGDRWSSSVSFDRQTRTVTIRLTVQDVNGHFIPNLRPENFAVYEDGVQQKNVSVDVEHTAVTLAVLLEGGGRYQQLNTFLHDQIPFVTQPLLQALGRDDKLAIFSYTNSVQTLLDFNQPPASLDSIIEPLKTAGFSEANLYDALVDVLTRMRAVGGRKAVLLISTGIDTFSHATFDDVLHAAEQSDTPVYVIGLADMAKTLSGTSGPFSKIDWKRADDQIKTLARVSGGRAYIGDSMIEAPAIYDDIMEHLRVRYVITYVSSNPATTGGARTVRVALVDPRTGAPPLRIVDADGRVVTARVVVQNSYTP